MLLEGLAMWPGKDNPGAKLLNGAIFIYLCFMEWGHATYVGANITDVITAASALTTVFTTFQVRTKTKRNK